MTYSSMSGEPLTLLTPNSRHPRAFKKKDGNGATAKGKSKLYSCKIGNAEETLGLRLYDFRPSKVRTMSYPSDEAGNERQISFPSASLG